MTAALSRDLRRFLATAPPIYRDGHQLVVPEDFPSSLLPELESLCLPSTTPEATKAILALLREHVGRVRYIARAAEAGEVVAELARAEVLAFDVETAPLACYRVPVPLAFTKNGLLRKRQPTTGTAGLALDALRSRVRLVSVFGGTETGAVVFDLYALPWAILDPLWSRPLVAANATFDVKRLILEAVTAPKDVTDILRTAGITHGLVGLNVSLASVARDTLGIVLPKGLAVSDWGAETLSREQLLYSAADAVVTYLVHQAQEAELSARQRTVRRLAGACIVPVCAMELAGIPIDRDRHREQIERWDTLLPEARERLRQAANGRNLEIVAELQAHLQEVVPPEERETWPTTSTGRLQADKLTLKLNRYLPALTELLAMRALKMLVSTFGSRLLEQIHPLSGRLHPSFRIGQAISGRFSCAGPNIQQAPSRDKAFRSIFKAPEGSVILSCDYGQIELRVLAQVVRQDLKRLVGEDSETVLDQMFASGQDVHWLTAKSMYALADDAVKEEHEPLRANAKAANFSLAFGMGLSTFTKRLRADREISIVEADEIRNAWFSALPDVALWQKLFAAERHRLGSVETWLGRPWYWRWRALDPDDVPDDVPFREDLIEGFSKPLCLNLRVQGSAAELMQLAVVYAHRSLCGSSGRLIATVHDELVVECPEGDLEEVRTLTVQAMTRAFQKLFPLAPLTGLVDAAAGPSWGEVK